MERIVLYGAGKRGRAIYKFLKSRNYADYIYGFCDERAKELKIIDDKTVYHPNELDSEANIVYCLTMIGDEIKRELRDKLTGKKCIEFADLTEYIGEDRVDFNRQFCAYYHQEMMDDYYERAENGLNAFWDENSVFYKYFKKLDLSNVIELGCGKGRHVTRYIDLAEKITLVDILKKNIDFCRERFKDSSKIFYYVNDGFDLKRLEDDQYSALFTYDAMVHFELIDIYSYLKDIYRVLRKGGKALFHHSNNYGGGVQSLFC